MAARQEAVFLDRNLKRCYNVELEWNRTMIGYDLVIHETLTSYRFTRLKSDVTEKNSGWGGEHG